MVPRPDTTLSRLQPAVLTVAAVAVGFSVYYIHRSFQQQDENSAIASSSSRLRRSNAIHHSSRPRRRLPRRSSTAAADPRPSSPHTPSGPAISAAELLELFQGGPATYGELELPVERDTDRASPSEDTINLPLVREGPPLDYFTSRLGLALDAARTAHQRYEETLVLAFLCRQLPSGTRILDPENVADAFRSESLSSAALAEGVRMLNGGRLDNDPARRDYEERVVRAESHREGPRPAPAREPEDGSGAEAAERSLFEAVTGLDLDRWDNLVDGESDAAGPGGGIDDDRGGGDPDADDSRKEGQSLLNMLYHIAEEQSRREGYVHRGVSCNSCNAHPIRGVRYRCANCVDYDLCEACETLQMHPRTHIFYKIRVPAPYLGNPRQPQPVWYPGRAIGLPNHLSREQGRLFGQRSGFDAPEVDALWDQFRCLAAVDWPEDPHRFGVAIDRDTFDRCFMPSGAAGTPRSPPTLLIYDRMFTFYDTNADGLIGFEEFVLGLATMRSKNPDERVRRIFHGYDHDRDGFVSRRDFLLMFRAFYALTKELTHDMVAGMEEDLLEGGSLRDNVAGTQPISSAYTGSIPYPEPSRRGEGKTKNRFGDSVIRDGLGAILDDPLDEGDHDKIIGEISEFKAFGKTGEDPRSPSSSNAQDSQDQPARDYEALRSLTDGDLAPRPVHAGTNGDAIRHHSLDAGTNGASVRPTNRDRALSEGATLASAIDAVSGRPREMASPTAVAEAQRHPPSRRSTMRVSVRQPSPPLDPQRQREREEDAARRRAAREEGLQHRRDRRHFYLDDEDGSKADKSQTRSGSHDPPFSSSGPGSQPTGEGPSLPAPSAAWLRFPPPLDQDVGREILYQITQEGLNELLDPLFKHREDLAVEYMRRADERAARAKDIGNFATAAASDPAVGEGVAKKVEELCRMQIYRLQSKWRLMDRGLSVGFRVRDELQRVVRGQRTKDHPEYMQNLYDMREVGLITDAQLYAKTTGVNPRLSSSSTRPEEQGNGTGSSNALHDGKHDVQEDNQALKAQGKSVDELLPGLWVHAMGSDRLDAINTSNGIHQESSPLPPDPESDTTSAPNNQRGLNGPSTVLEEAVLNTDIKSLLEAAGYAAPTQPSQPATSQPDTSEATTDGADPTLPQNRPRAATKAVSNIPADSAARASGEDVHDGIRKFDARGGWTPEYWDRLKFLTLLDAVEREDDERGGAGKLSFAEFDEILKGPRGSELGLLGSWVEMVNF